MLKLILITGILMIFIPATGQDFSNKGKDFWIAYGNHVRMFETITAGNQAEKMELYMTSDVSTTGAVTIPGINFSANFTVTANQITTVEIPHSAGLPDESIYNLGIHVTSEKPIIVYSFIYVNAVSGATLCLPVVTLGREYYSVNFTQVSNVNNSYSYYDVIATDTGVTAVEIIPAQNTKGGHLAGVPYVVNLTQGQVYQALGVLTSNSNPFRGTDFTGSRIRSISTATTKCKKIAVFCGSGKISIGCPGSGTSDNLYQQMYPVSTWGKTYITVPSINNASTANQYNYYRIFKSDVSATVRLNGAVVPNASFVNGQYYEFNVNQANLIESDKPILVAQYFSSGGCNSNIGNGDPEMIYLNPVEQTISSVTLNSMQPPASNTNINEHHINVVLKNAPEVINTFRIDGVPAGKFVPLPASNNYAYAQITVAKGAHTLNCDSGFNAISYGFGNAESYGYSAGTNLKDLYQFVSIHNQYATVNFPAGCKNSPFEFSMTFPYQPTNLKWIFKGLFADTSVKAPAYDSSWIVNGRTLYRYTLKRKYIITAIGTYPIKIIADNPTADGCSGEQEIDYDLQIFERPAAAFSVSQTGCITDPVNFTDSTNAGGRNVISWIWKFGDGASSDIKAPSHTYTTSGTYTVSFSSITDIGCLSDTVTKKLVFTPSPMAAFTLDAACASKPVKFMDASTPVNGGLAKWSWDFGDGGMSTAQNPSHVYTNTGKFLVKLDIETITGCKSAASSNINVNAVPRVGFGTPAVCLNDPFAAFTDSSSINDNSGNQLNYLWNFGDAAAGTANPNTSTLKNPTHKYTSVGLYNVGLKVTSKDGCSSDTIKQFTVNGAVPKADFVVNAAGRLCSNQDVTIGDQSSVDFGNITRIEVYWDYANDPTAKTVDNDPGSKKVYTHKYVDFGTPATKSFQIVYIAYSGASCMQQQNKTIVLLASPAIKFDTILPVCQDVPAFQVTAARELYGFSGTGVYSGSGISSSGLFNPKLAGAGTKAIAYLFTASNGCTARQSQSVIVYPSPAVNAGPDRTLLEGGAITLAASASANSSYLWSPAIAINNATILTPTVSPADNADYQLTVTSSEGCSASDNMRVIVLKDIKVPNAFSPNGDGINDTWNIQFLESYPGATIEVFNRYGQQVFRSVGYSKPWDGRYNGNSLPFGTYYWLINPKNGKAAINGSVTIIR